MADKLNELQQKLIYVLLLSLSHTASYYTLSQNHFENRLIRHMSSRRVQFSV